MLMYRLVTAIILAAVFLVTLFATSPLVFIGFCFFALAMAAWEWAAFAELKKVYQPVLFVAANGILMLLVASATGFVEFAVIKGVVSQNLLLALFSVGIAFWFCMFAVLLGYPGSQRFLKAKITRLLMGVILLLVAWASLLYLRHQEGGQFWVLYVVAVVAAADIGAYFFGKLFGSRKLAPAVSPGKTWEGFAGGLVVSQLFALGLFVYFSLAKQSPLPSLDILLFVTALLAAVSVLGDLFESILKRGCGLKDSGSILPGHGGILDRLDGLVAALPVFAFIFMLQGW